MNCLTCARIEARFRCKCGARYCGVTCQKAHWHEHKADCRATHAKMEMDRVLKFVIDEWDNAKYACFMHARREDAIAGGYTHAVATGEIPNKRLTSGGVMCFLELDVVQPMIDARLKHNDNVLQCLDWTLALPECPPRQITSIVLNCSGRPADSILQLYAPELARTGRLALHFFDHDKAVDVMGPLMDVE